MKKDELDEYLEIHYEMVCAVEDALNDKEISDLMEDLSYTGLGFRYILAKSLTDKFYKKHKNTAWGEDLDWWDTIEKFVNKHLYGN